MKSTTLLLGAAAIAGSLSICSAVLAASGDVGKLGTELTPLGGDKSAARDIPAWTGTEAPTGGWSYGKNRLDHWQHKAEKPLFSIDAANVDKHAARLAPGQLALIKQIPGYRMDVYPSHRTCGAPDFVAENTRRNVGFSSTSAGGMELKDAYLPGIPFPMPATGAEVMWNTKLRYQGVGFNLPKSATFVSPRKGADTWIKVDNETTNYVPWGEKGSQKLSEMEDVEYYAYNLALTPVAFAGQATMMTNKLNSATETFMYFPGQRRVRRMSTFAYDSPLIGYENQYGADEIMVFSGRIDRFDWKLVGKKEIYIPYNAFGGYDFNEKMENIAKDNFVAPAFRRYEAHRVWEVQATVKQGARHIAPKRTFYVDEDSWIIVAGEDYDANGTLIKTREAFPIPVYELGACGSTSFVEYNITEGRYLMDISPAATGKDVQWFAKPEGSRFRKSFYTSENLRAISDR